MLSPFQGVHFILKPIYLNMGQCMITTISAFLSEPKTPDPDMNLQNLQFWNCMDYGVVAVQKQFIGSMSYEVYTRDRHHGGHICMHSDNYHQDPDVVDYATSENPAEHKSHNLIELVNGQYALYPNNRTSDL